MRHQITYGSLLTLLLAGHVMAGDVAVDYSLRSVFSQPQATLDERYVGDAEQVTDISFRIAPREKDEFGSSFGVQPAYTISTAANPVADDELYQLPRPDTGFRYRASLRVLAEESHSLPSIGGHSVGLSYGSYARDWYHGLDLSVADYADGAAVAGAQWSLGYTTGRRFGSSWAEAEPMWLLSLRGDFSNGLVGGDLSRQTHGDWYLTPSLFWSLPDFTLAAGVELPMNTVTSSGQEPDYRLRATFQHRF